MMEYESKLITEAIAVGGITVIVNRLVQRMLPRASPLLQLFLTGVTIHLGCEYTGLNEWYIKNGAAGMKKECEEEKQIYPALSGGKCQYITSPSSQSSSAVGTSYTRGFVKDPGQR